MNRATILIIGMFVALLAGYGLGYLKWGRKPKEEPKPEPPKPQ